MEIEDVYRCFRKAQSSHFNRGYRMPKDFDKHLMKMSKVNREALRTITGLFKTKWSRIDPIKYFKCGFELFNNFTYVQFLDKRILNLYIQRDKLEKRKSELNKMEMVRSAKFIREYMDSNNIRTFGIYCMMEKNGYNLVLTHYLKNKIDHFLFTWLMKRQLIRLTEDEKSLIPYIMNGYRDTFVQLEDEKYRPFLRQLKGVLG